MSYVFSEYNIVGENNGVAYIVNTLSGALIRLDKETYEALKLQNMDILSEQQQTTLKNCGMLIDENIDEKRVMRAAYSAYCHGRKSLNVIACPTLDCNFACPYCFEERQKGFMSAEVENALLLYVEKLLIHGYEQLNFEWFGGEPLLYPNLVDRVSHKIIKLCEKYRAEHTFSITTNGYCVDEAVLSVLSEIRFKEVRITLDGNRESHDTRRVLRNGQGTFDVIVSNIKKISERGIQVKVRVNIDKQNPEAFFQVKKELDGIENLFIYPATVVEEPTQGESQKAKCYAMSEYEDFHQTMYHTYGFKPSYEGIFQKGVCSCMAEHDESCVIDHNGYVYKCVNDVGHPEWAICNVLDSGEKRSAVAVSKYLGRDPLTETPCNDCKLLPICYGGCVYELMRHKTHDCARVKYLFEDIVAEKLGSRKEKLI